MTDRTDTSSTTTSTPNPTPSSTTSPTPSNDLPEKKFHGWRLLGVIFIIMLVLAGVSALVDWMVIGPLEGRAY